MSSNSTTTKFSDLKDENLESHVKLYVKRLIENDDTEYAPLLKLCLQEIFNRLSENGVAAHSEHLGVIYGTLKSMDCVDVHDASKVASTLYYIYNHNPWLGLADDPTDAKRSIDRSLMAAGLVNRIKYATYDLLVNNSDDANVHVEIKARLADIYDRIQVDGLTKHPELEPIHRAMCRFSNQELREGSPMNIAKALFEATNGNPWAKISPHSFAAGQEAPAPKLKFGQN